MERTKTVVWNVNHFWDDENGNPTEWVCSNAANEPYLWILKKEGEFEVRDTVNPEFTALKSVSSLEEAMKWAAENNLGIVNKEPYRVAGISGMYFYDRVNSLVICASELGEERRQENDQWIEKYGEPLYDIFTVDGKDYVEWDAIGLNIENWENVELRNEYLYEWETQHKQEVGNLIKQDEKLQAGLNDKLHYMVEGMDKLLGELNKYHNGKTFTVEEITGISNILYCEMTKKEEAQESEAREEVIKAPEILNEYNLVDQLTEFFTNHPEISNQMDISNRNVEDFMDSIYDEDGEFHKDWLKQEVMDAVSEPVDISMDLHNVDLSEEQLTDYNMNLQACIDKTDKLSRTIDWLLEKNPEYYKELSNCQATMKYNSEWMKDDMKLLDDRMNRVLSENIEKAVDQVIDETEPEVDFGMEM